MNSPRIKVGLVAAAPGYYHSPLYRLVAAHPAVDFTAIFASNAGIRPYDVGFGHAVVWDDQLIDGYRTHFLRNATKNPQRGNFVSLRDVDVVPHIINGRYDVIWLHGYNFLTHQLAAWTQLARRSAVIVREEQNLANPRPAWKQMLKAIGLRTLLAQSYGLYIGTRNRQWFEHYGVRPDRLFFTPYTVDNSSFQKSARALSSQKQQIRESFGISSQEGPTILFVGKLAPKKQPSLLLEAFQRVRKNHQCNLLLVGAGELEQALRRTVENEQIPNVHFAGFLNRTQVSRAYATADVFVLPSKFDETWGLVVNEAMNFSLPIVVSESVGSSVDLVKHGENGFVFPHDDPLLLADHLVELVKSPQRRASMGAGSLSVVNGWNYEVAAKGVVAAIKHAVGKDRWEQALCQ